MTVWSLLLPACAEARPALVCHQNVPRRQAMRLSDKLPTLHGKHWGRQQRSPARQPAPGPAPQPSCLAGLMPPLHARRSLPCTRRSAHTRRRPGQARRSQTWAWPAGTPPGRRRRTRCRLWRRPARPAGRRSGRRSWGAGRLPCTAQRTQRRPQTLRAAGCRGPLCPARWRCRGTAAKVGRGGGMQGRCNRVDGSGDRAPKPRARAHRPMSSGSLSRSAQPAHTPAGTRCCRPVRSCCRL